VGYSPEKLYTSAGNEPIEVDWTNNVVPHIRRWAIVKAGTVRSLPGNGHEKLEVFALTLP